MLTILTGTGREEKRTRMLEIAQNAANRGNQNIEKNILWLTPDQFTFETERDLMHRLPPSVRVRMTVTGFSRYSDMIMKQYGGVAVRYADNLCKSILMRRALSDCKDQLRLYQKQVQSMDSGFQEQLLQFIRQMKFSGIQPDQLLQAGENTDLPENLRAKTADLGSIAMYYEMRLSSAWRDNLDDLSAAAAKIKDREENHQEKIFAGKTVLLDGFKSFTAPQYEFIRLMLRQGADVYVSLLLDYQQAKKELYSIYALTLDTYEHLEGLSGGHCQKETYQTKMPENALDLVKKSLFDEPLRVPETKPEDDSVQVFSCRDEYAEAEYCLGTLKSLLKDAKGSLRLRDIAVVYRDDAYRLPIASAAMKFELPYCVDGGNAPQSEPLFTVCFALLKAAFIRFSSIDALSVMKSGLFEASDMDIAQLEEYLYVWQPQRLRDWKKPFDAKLSGYELEELGREQQLGDAPELLRARYMDAISPLFTAENHTGREFGELLYEALEKLGVIRRFAENLQALDDLNQQMQQKRVWNIFGDILTRLSDTIAEEKISGAEYYRLFAQSVKETKIKAVEQTMDCILVGSADQIRLHDPKVVWILGANEGIFPKRPNAQSGLFSDMECKQMSEFDIVVGKTLEERLNEERFIAYQMVCAPTQRLYISYRKANLGGEKQLASELIWRFERLLDRKAVPGNLSQAQRMTTAASVLDSYCHLVRSDKQEALKYLDLLRKLPENRYAAILDAVNSIQLPKRYVLSGKDTIEQLYTLYQRMLSPSEIEQYYQCPFAYFVKYGLKLRIRERAAYNPLLRGNIVHHVIAELTPQLSAKAKADAQKAAEEGSFANSQQIKDEIRQMVEAAFEAQLEKRFENPGKICAKDKALAQSMLLTILRIAENIYAEQLQSKFEVLAVECDIGNKRIAPLSIAVDDTHSIRIRGRIDRLDIYYEADKKYFRIIDYKTGNKKFEYVNLLSGEHLQMILYEMAVANGATGNLTGMIPSGVLYYPARKVELINTHHLAEAEKAEYLAGGFCMNGILVDEKEELLRMRAMEEKLQEHYIPVGMDQKQQVDDSSLRTQQEYRKIENYVRRQVKNMAKEVSSGGIEPVYYTDTTACEYCEYRELCGKDVRIESCERTKVSEEEAQQMIYGQEEVSWD